MVEPVTSNALSTSSSEHKDHPTLVVTDSVGRKYEAPCPWCLKREREKDAQACGARVAELQAEIAALRGAHEPRAHRETGVESFGVGEVRSTWPQNQRLVLLEDYEALDACLREATERGPEEEDGPWAEGWAQRAAQPPRAGWQPIESAPDGEYVLVAHIACQRICWAQAAKRGAGVTRLCWFNPNGKSTPDPTHWMPLQPYSVPTKRVRCPGDGCPGCAGCRAESDAPPENTR